MRNSIKIMRILAFIALVFITSCVTKEKCYERFPPQVKEVRETTFVQRDSVIPGAIIRDTIRLDSIAYIQNFKIIKDTTGRAELRLYKDAYGRLIAECEAKGIDIKWLEQVIKDSKVEVNEIEKRYIPWWIWVVLGLLLPGTIYLLIIVIPKIIRKFVLPL
jgi:hypothetical protein